MWRTRFYKNVIIIIESYQMEFGLSVVRKFQHLEHERSQPWNTVQPPQSFGVRTQARGDLKTMEILG